MQDKQIVRAILRLIWERSGLSGYLVREHMTELDQLYLTGIWYINNNAKI
jgi:hypothetical protein